MLSGQHVRAKNAEREVECIYVCVCVCICVCIYVFARSLQSNTRHLYHTCRAELSHCSHLSCSVAPDKQEMVVWRQRKSSPCNFLSFPYNIRQSWYKGLSPLLLLLLLLPLLHRCEDAENHVYTWPSALRV